MNAVDPRPDFIVLGAMKGGTTWLFRALEGHPQVCLPRRKELAFFLTDKEWHRGKAWYHRQFSACDGMVTGEATPGYLDPRSAGEVALRVRDVCPDARLIVVLRDPLSRARSHYIHDVMRGRSVPPPSNVFDSEHRYLRRSLYWAGLRHFHDHGHRDQLLVLTMDDLLTGDGWTRLLRHLFLDQHPRPTGSVNDSARRLRTPRWLPRSVAELGSAVLPSGVRRRVRTRLPQGPPEELHDALEAAVLSKASRAALLSDLQGLRIGHPDLAVQVSTWYQQVEGHP